MSFRQVQLRALHQTNKTIVKRIKQHIWIHTAKVTNEYKWRLTRIPYQKCINPAGDCYILLLGVGVDPTYSKITHLSLHFLGQTFTTSTNQKLNIIQSCECWKGSQTPRRSSMRPCFGPLFQLLVFLEKKHNDSVLRASLRMGKYMEHPVKICFSRSWSKI